MKRQYDSEVVRDDVLTFTGIEVERTPCFGMKTYFVVGVPREEPYVFVNKVMKHDAEQIYFVQLSIKKLERRMDNILGKFN